MKRFLVLAMRTPGFNPAVVAPHRQFLDELRAAGKLELSGGFSDGSGGAYVLLAEHMDAARAIVMTDPLHTTGASLCTVHEWNA